VHINSLNSITYVLFHSVNVFRDVIIHRYFFLCLCLLGFYILTVLMYDVPIIFATPIQHANIDFVIRIYTLFAIAFIAMVFASA